MLPVLLDLLFVISSNSSVWLGGQGSSSEKFPLIAPSGEGTVSVMSRKQEPLTRVKLIYRSFAYTPALHCIHWELSSTFTCCHLLTVNNLFQSLQVPWFGILCLNLSSMLKNNTYLNSIPWNIELLVNCFPWSQLEHRYLPGSWVTLTLHTLCVCT